MPQKFSTKETFTHIRELNAEDAKELESLMLGANYDEKEEGNIMNKVKDF